MGPLVSGDLMTSKKGPRYSIGSTTDQSEQAMGPSEQIPMLAWLQHKVLRHDIVKHIYEVLV